MAWRKLLLTSGKTAITVASFLTIMLLLSGCASDTPPDSMSTAPVSDVNVGLPSSFALPTEEGRWVPAETHQARKPIQRGQVEIEGIGTFTFDPAEVKTVRSDIFQPGHFSVFDALVQLDQQGDIDLEYHFDGAMDTHIIDTINGKRHWWYEVKYSAGWFEPNVFRMDMYPYKDNTDMRVYPHREEYLARICRTFGNEVARLAENKGKLVIPSVAIRGPNTLHQFENVAVDAHDIRSDILKPGVITALDILLSLGEQGRLSDLKLTWYDRIMSADPVDSYWVEQIDSDVAFGGCGFVYETGPTEFSGFAGSHIHIPLDVRAIVSPEYAFWFWICL